MSTSSDKGIQMTYSICATSHIRDLLDPEKQLLIVDECCHRIEKNFQDCEYIAVTGLSGIIIGSQVAALVNKRLIVVRKDKDSIHRSYDLEGVPFKHDFSYIILDDFIDRGETINNIRNKVEKCIYSNSKATLTGILLYASDTLAWKMQQSFVANLLEKIPVQEFCVK